MPKDGVYYKAGAISAINGTAKDAVSNVSKVEVMVVNQNDGQYWQDDANGDGAWSGTKKVLTLSTGSPTSNDWSYTFNSRRG